MTGPAEQGLQPGRYQVIPRVLVFLTYKNDVLLLRGAQTKRIWPGLLNGLGGHIEAGEDPVSAAVREVHEEGGVELSAPQLRLRAVVSIDSGDVKVGILNFIFTASVESREVRDSSEGSLEWHEFSAISSLPLVADLPWLLPRILDDSLATVVFARSWYDDTGKLRIEEA